MDVQKIATVTGALLLMFTIAVEFRVWWSQVQDAAARRRAALVSLLNIIAAVLLIFPRS